ncbi:hypothetical protein C8J57DRAFT_1309423 [Mycena rebaudengoi]|nr:hypothetical protein C8J57DRAFT_1309423 [Mycena rebaudengoi]
MVHLSVFAPLCSILFAILHGVAALPAPPSIFHGIERRDILDFWATQNWLQFMANTFAQDNFAVSDGLPRIQLFPISHALFTATTRTQSVGPANSFTPKFSVEDATTINTLFISSTSTILSHLHSLLFSKAFFSTVNNNGPMRIVMCHWVNELARQNDAFLSLLTLAAPSADFSTPWTQIQTNAAAGYSDFLGNLNGLRCGGL